MVIKSDDNLTSRLLKRSRTKESKSAPPSTSKPLKGTKKPAHTAQPKELNSQVALNIGVGKKTYDSADIAKSFLETQAQTTPPPEKDPGLW